MNTELRIATLCLHGAAMWIANPQDTHPRTRFIHRLGDDFRLAYFNHGRACYAWKMQEPLKSGGIYTEELPFEHGLINIISETLFVQYINYLTR